MMELEDRLKSFARFNLTHRKGAVTSQGKDRIVELVDGEVAENRFGGFVLVRKRFDQSKLYREIKLSSSRNIKGEFLARVCSSRKSSTKGVCPTPFDLKEAVFIDCETTGLAGGVGTYAFLVGLGYLKQEEFWIEQYFMQDFHQERAVLSAIAERLGDFRFLVSFNGKCYDLPLLENRFVFNRIDFDPTHWAHLDLLFPCRRLWKRRIGECSLSNIEHQILRVRREIDVPSYMVPQIYFDYLRTGEAESLVPVFYHNSYDILSLLKLSILIDKALSAGQLTQMRSIGEDFNLAEVEDPIDLYSLGRIHQNLGNYHASVRCFEQALSENLPPQWQLEIYVSLAFVYKRTGCMEEAVRIWQKLTEGDFSFSLSAHEELAKYHEHKRKDYLKALSFVDRAISELSSDPSLSFASVHQRKLDSLEYRKSRLERKNKNASDCA